MGKRGTSLSTALDELADIVDELDEGGAEVIGVSTRTESDQQELHADLELRISVDEPDESVGMTTSVEHDAAPPDDGVPEAGQSPDESGADETTADSKGPADSDRSTVECRYEGCDEQFDTEHGMKIHHTKVHVSGAEADDLPPHRDPDALREVYTAHDSFTEMREALGTDVSAQTVRRQTIEHGIHGPGAADDAGVDATEDDPDSGPAGDGSSSPTAADETPDGDDAGDDPDAAPSSDEEAIASPADDELPGDLTVADVRDAVEDGATLYEVQQALDLDREAARELLSWFDLLELVYGRVATQPDREARKAEIEDRIRANDGAGVESESD